MPPVRSSGKNSLDCGKNSGVLFTDGSCVDQSMEKLNNEPLYNLTTATICFALSLIAKM
jgi:hypothetical protein